MQRVRILGWSLGLVLSLAACGAIQSSHQVSVSPATLALIKAQPEFADVACADNARLTVVGAEVASESLLLSITCVAF